MNTTALSNTILSQQYQYKTDIEHIKDNPDTYIGSVETVDAQIWTYQEETKKIALNTIELIPGLFKLYDECIINARDHVIRMNQSNAENKKCVTHIDVSVSSTDGCITMMNDGNGIDVAKHPETQLWIPEMIFAHLRTSTNYNKEEQRIVGGKNGFGIKLVFIWSTYGYIETVDHIRGLKYTQEFKKNMSEICPPKITSAKSTKPYTKIVFIPDYARFGMPNGLTEDMMNLFKKRAFDIAAVSDHSVKKIKVSYNSEILPVKNFTSYIDLYIGAKDTVNGARVYETSCERWEYAVALSPTHEFMHISFVNGISTHKGGKHVDYILGQILRKLCAYIEKKKKITVNQNSIKEQLILFLRCDINNPAFDSQTKDYMNTPSNKFGSTCVVSDSFIEKIAKMGVMDLACSLTEAKETKLAKKTDGSKTKTIRGISNFIDANYSGTVNSYKCILILCEGLSALSGIVSGLSSEDRNIFGIYPLKGKILNVRGEVVKKIAENKEITDVKKILGLEIGKQYSTMDDVNRNLRYGKIMIMTDADLDGSHIKGLCINLFHSEWASLVHIPGFLSFMNTPILRAKKGIHTRLFYNDGEYKRWKETAEGEQNNWTIKYFKGLGTSTATEFKEYFVNKKIVNFQYTGQPSDDSIDKVFNKKRTDDRKRWLEQYNKDLCLDTSQEIIPYEKFIDDDMRHFSIYDCARSIPNMVDGLKTSLRKILYSAFKRKLVNEIKVAQFSGYVSEHSAYHHGEQSLNSAIVGMAQNFVGSNNINILEPSGQFGTRLQGGKDSASERYIFTFLNPITRCIFPEADDSVLMYLNDDGVMVEPEYYVPIIPFALINEVSGIGTGFSSSIPSFSPIQLISALKIKLSHDPEPPIQEFIPYYEGFKGAVSKITDSKFLIKGVYRKLENDDIQITELPIGTWTMPYITILEGLLDGGVDKSGKKILPSIKDFVSVSTESIVDIKVSFPKGKVDELEASVDENGVNGIEKLLKLTTTVSTTNMHLFDHECKLHKYNNVNEIIDAYYPIRIEIYHKRKEYLLRILDEKMVKLNNRMRYIQETLLGNIDLRRKKAQEVENLLLGLNFVKIDDNFKYLIKMPMDSVTEENVLDMKQECEKTKRERDLLFSTTIEQMWLGELNILEKQYIQYKTQREQLTANTKAVKPIKNIKIIKKVKN